ncbi:MAG: sulfate adenylyltransferase subunit CysN [Pseudomonadota bacterium]
MTTSTQDVTPKMDILRFITAGSVDDGKSTLTGRLLYDSKSIFEDQLEAITRTTARRGGDGVDLALLTDGLQAEREQGITIDVAYRYFATPKRKFIIADAPGHEQYTRNMVTGASTANVAVILIDARKGVLTQSRRHAYIANLLGIPHFIVAINKMDLVDYSEQVYQNIRAEFGAFAQRLGVPDVRFIPISSLHGDMVVTRGDNLPWYRGETLMDALENIKVARDFTARPFRFPVQLVCRPQRADLHDFRGYMGRIESGSIKAGDEIVVLPSGLRSRVKEIVTYDGNLQEAVAPQSVTLTLADHIDISRGDLIARPHDAPRVAKQFAAWLCWMSEQPMQSSRKYLIKHTTSTVKAMIAQVEYKVDINTLNQISDAAELKMNDIARVRIKVQKPVICDLYRENRATGGFIVIDEHTNNTVAAGMIEAVE